MKIEMINENQLRCTLTKEDLAARHMKLSELAYGTAKAKLLFREMIEKATSEYGFVTEDIPLMIEAIPMSSDSIVLMISKVSEPDELDTRFSDFTAYDEDEMDDSMLSDMEEINSNDNAGFLDLFKRLYDKFEQSKNNGKSSSLINKDAIIVTFFSMNNAVRMARDLKNFNIGRNTLYRSPKGSFVLVMKLDELSDSEFAGLCMVISEYGKTDLCLNGSDAHIQEHFKELIKNDALEVLSKMQSN